jgi:drug/metabolite transporter (DMT)-like permease
MQALYFAAGSLALITGIVHSVLGEVLIFRHLRSGGLVPAMGAPPLRERNIRIIWATWHLGSVFGWAFAGVLLRLAVAPHDSSLTAFVLSAIVLANLGASLLVLIGTKGRHPGWIALLAVAALTWLAAVAA